MTTTSKLPTVATTGGCCHPASPGPVVPAAVEPPASQAVCCGSAQAAAEAGACCDPAAKARAVDAGARCCG
jgi:hypothetical protein